MDEREALNQVINGLCRTRAHHDALITGSVKDAVLKPQTPDPIQNFANYLCRRVLKNESVIVNDVTLAALFPQKNASSLPLPEDGLFRLQRALKNQPDLHELESQPVLSLKTGQPILLVVSRHTFRVLEITHDIWKILHPDASDETRERHGYVSNITKVVENLMHMGSSYGPQDIIDCLNLISPDGAFFLRAGFLFMANIEFMPFSETLESKGFHVSIFIDENETNETHEEYDLLKRLQGFLITRNAEAHERALKHADFLQSLTQETPLPKTIAKTLQLG